MPPFIERRNKMECVNIIKCNGKCFYIMKDPKGFWGVESKYVGVRNGKWKISDQIYGLEENLFATHSECAKAMRKNCNKGF